VAALPAFGSFIAVNPPRRIQMGMRFAFQETELFPGVARTTRRGGFMIRRILVSCLLSAALAFAATSAHASRDEVQFGSNIKVPQGTSIHDAVCFFCSVDAQGTVDHDIVVFFGNVRIAGHADHDVVNFFGSVRAEDNASVGHDLVSFFGSIRLGDNVSVGNDMVAMFGGVSAPDSVSVGGNRVVQPGWILWIPLMIAGVIIIVVVREVRAWRRRQYYGNFPHPPHP
jgi:hypothetical protein